MAPALEAIATPPQARPKLPGQIAYIIGNEGCERFSFYGMRNILTQFLVSSALLFAANEIVSKEEREVWRAHTLKPAGTARAARKPPTARRKAGS